MLDEVARLPGARATLRTFAQARADIAGDPGAAPGLATLPGRVAYCHVLD